MRSIAASTARAPRTSSPCPTDPLPLPGDCSSLDVADAAAAPSVQLYTRTLAALQPGFRLHPGNVAAVVEVCVALRGVPADLRVAARFAALEGHGALRAALLDPCGPEAAALLRTAASPLFRETGNGSGLGPSGHRILASAAVFAGGCGPEALRHVAGVSAEEFPAALHTLLDDRRIALTDHPSGTLLGLASARLHLQPAATRGTAAVLPDARAAHARYYTRLAHACARRAAGGEGQAEALRAIDAERHNLNAATQTLLAAGHRGQAIELLDAARVQRHATDPFSAGADTLARLLGATPGGTTESLRLLLAEARLRDGEREAAAALLRTPGPPSPERRRLTALVTLCGDPAAGRTLLRGLAAEPAAADHALPARQSLLDLALAELLAGDAGAAATAADQALIGALRQGDRLTAGRALLRLALVEAVLGRDPADYVTRALVHLRPLGGPVALGTFAELGGSHLLPGITARAAGAALAVGAFHRYRRTSPPCPAVPDLACGRLERRLRGLLDESTLTSVLRQGAELTLPRAVERLARAWVDERPVRVTPSAAGREPAARVTSPARHAVLTRRQFEVGRLVAEGLSNKQIARRLGISEWTAVNHLREVMRRLECTSRVQVAGWVREQESREDRAGGPAR